MSASVGHATCAATRITMRLRVGIVHRADMTFVKNVEQNETFFICCHHPSRPQGAQRPHPHRQGV
jgi:hypothetical protein